jgi:predicted unusual protein kinase regulating ubiquinone biosynthesis (AarF/ABC1/UbiB family)
MTPERAEGIERAVEEAVERWQASGRPDAAVEAPTETPAVADIVRPMPRRELVHTFDAAAATLPMARRPTYRAGILYPLLRLLVWMRVFVYFVSGNAVDFLLRRGSTQERAVRLRRLFQSAGGSFGKLAQQLAPRADILPYPYCAELSKMLDQAPAFPTSDAIAIIERELGKPLADVFEIFDPDPIGSASVACVYQACLRSGQRVAVKVRRPDIARKLSADLRALDWLLIAAEALTIIRPGLTASFRQEIRKSMLSELNFRGEARYTEMFRLRKRSHDDVIW